MARDNRGQDLVEYALTLPILLLLVLGIMEFGVAVFSYNTLAHAAREGARVGAVAIGTLEEIEPTIEAAVQGRTGGLRLTEENITITQTEETTSSEKIIHVAIEYSHPMITGLILRSAGGDLDLQLRSEASMRREFRGDL